MKLTVLKTEWWHGGQTFWKLPENLVELIHILWVGGDKEIGINGTKIRLTI